MMNQKERKQENKKHKQNEEMKSNCTLPPARPAVERKSRDKSQVDKSPNDEWQPPPLRTNYKHRASKTEGGGW